MFEKSRRDLLAETFSVVLNFINRHKIEAFSLVIIWSALVLSLSAANQSSVSIKSGAQISPQIILPPNQETAKNILNWVSTKKDSRGIYFLNCNNLICDNPTPAGKSGHGGLPLIWGRFQYFQKTNDQNELVFLNADLNNYSNGIKIPFIQNQNWNCKLMYKIAGSALVSSDIKAKAERLCMTSEYFPLSAGSQGIREIQYYPSDFVAKYQWKGIPSYLETAKNYFTAASRGYNASKDKLTPDDICALGESAVDLYKVTNDSNYLVFAKDLFAKEFNFLSPVCGLFADSLFKTTNNSNYFVKKNLVLTNLVQNKQTVTFDLRKVGLLIGLLSE